ncbi:MAG: hypothetical protein ACJ72E_03465 [Marmoricola sp.]
MKQPEWFAQLDGWRREAVVWGAVAAATIALGAVIGTAISTNPPRSHEVVVSHFDTLVPGDVELVKAASPKVLDDPVGIGFKSAGIAVTAASQVDSVTVREGDRRAPEGSNLIAFTVGDWTCEDQPCAHWQSLGPRISLDGESQALPDGGKTFVVVVPPGTEAVDLVVSADGFTQSVSLLDHTHGSDTIELLARPAFAKKVTLARTFQITEQTSIPLDDGLGGTSSQFVRQVTVDYAQARFFLGSQRPSDPGKEFLVINTYYSFPGRQGSFILTPGEVTFVDKAGRHYPPRDLDPSPTNGLLGFEVPATVRSGTLVVGGGTTTKTASNGTSYTSTLSVRRVPIALGS